MSKRKPRPWGVAQLSGGDWVAYRKVYPFVDGRFGTHAEAIAFADRQARTVSIYVPPVGERGMLPAPATHVDDPVGIRRVDRGVLLDFGGDECFIHDDECVFLARFLLAHHGKAQAND